MGVPAVPLNVTVLVPWVVPKVVPEIVTAVPATPEVGERLVIPGTTVNDVPLLFTPLARTTTLPVVAPEGTGTTIAVVLQLLGLAKVPLKETVLVPCVDPKPLPLTVTEAPTAPDPGEILLMLGAGTTVNATPLLVNPFTVTRTFPVVAPAGTGTTIEPEAQLLGVAVVPLKVTVLLP